MLSGYLGDPGMAEVVARAVAAVRRARPGGLYFCDPVIGDDEPGVFVSAGVPEAIRDRLVPLADIVTRRAIAARTAAQPDLWAACIAGAGQRDRYLQDIAAAGLELRTVRSNPAYRFASERAQATSDKYGAHTIELLAVKPGEEVSR